MAQLLTCPNRHHWDLTEDPAVLLPITRGLCPMCGEPPVADSPLDWEREPSLIAAATVLLAFGALFLPAPLLHFPGTDLNCCGWVAFLVVLCTGAALGGWLEQRGRAPRLTAAAAALGFTFRAAWPKAEVGALGLPPCLWPGGLFTRHRNVLEGDYQGCRVVLFDGEFLTPPDKTRRSQTVVFFPEPVPGLPDFRLEPTRYPSWHGTSVWTRDLLDLLPFRRRNPFRDEPFGRWYDLKEGDAAAVGPWLAPPLRDFLAGQKGWVVGAHGGRFYLYRPGRRCRADAWATFAAVAWRLRGMLRPALLPPSPLGGEGRG